jgi:hypothetical protein
MAEYKFVWADGSLTVEKGADTSHYHILMDMGYNEDHMPENFVLGELFTNYNEFYVYHRSSWDTPSDTELRQMVESRLPKEHTPYTPNIAPWIYVPDEGHLYTGDVGSSHEDLLNARGQSGDSYSAEGWGWPAGIYESGDNKVYQYGYCNAKLPKGAKDTLTQHYNAPFGGFYEDEDYLSDLSKSSVHAGRLIPQWVIWVYSPGRNELYTAPDETNHYELVQKEGLAFNSGTWVGGYAMSDGSHITDTYGARMYPEYENKIRELLQSQLSHEAGMAQDKTGWPVALHNGFAIFLQPDGLYCIKNENGLVESDMTLAAAIAYAHEHGETYQVASVYHPYECQAAEYFFDTMGPS